MKNNYRSPLKYGNAYDADSAKPLFGKKGIGRISITAATRWKGFAQPDFNIFYNASTLIVICAKLRGPFVVADCWLAAENLMLAACSMGLGTSIIGSAVPGLDTAETKAMFRGTRCAIPPCPDHNIGVPRGCVRAQG